MPPQYRTITLNDFSGGWVTVNGALSLASNQCSDILNLIPLNGRLRFRGGYNNVAAQPFKADAAQPFFDADGGKHYAIWAGGNLYDAVSGIYVLKAAGVYTPGNRIGHTILRGVLYWSCGRPNPVKMQFWDPAAGTLGPVGTFVGVGYIDPPASNFLFTYLNCIMALAPTWGSPGPTVFQPTLLVWSDVDRPDKWFGANGQAVGSDDGGELVFGMQFGIANTGVSPSRQIIIGRSDLGIYSYSGAMPTLEENVLNCPVGCRDADTVQYAPMTGLFGCIYFLGTDGQFWQLNGINAQPVSQNITDNIVSTVNAAVAANPNLRFSSGYNEEWQYYWCDVNGTQYVYRWQGAGAWTKFQGWPSGPTFFTTGFTGAPAYFVASNSDASPYLSQIALDNVADNGVMPPIYYETAALHGGDIKLMKEFLTITLGAYDSGAKYAISGKGNKRIGGTYMQSEESMLTTPGEASVAGQFVLGTSILGGSDVLGAGNPAIGGSPTIMQTVLRCPVTPSKWMPDGTKETLKANAGTFKIRYAGGSTTCEILTIEVQYVPLGYMRGAGEQFNPTAGAPDVFDPFSSPVG